MGIVFATCRIPWSPYGWPRALAIHAAIALVYATLSAWASWLLFSVTWDWFAGQVTWQQHQPGVVVWQCFMALMIYAIVSSVTYAFLASKRLREEENRASRAEALRTKAELQALRAQLNPHFLFNTLHSLLALVRADSIAAEDAIEQFADLLRYASRVHHQPGDEVALVEEWEFVRNYLALESLRIGDRLRIDEHMDGDAADCMVPSFCLQPLVENAIRHAIAPKAAGGSVRIRAAVTNGRLALDVIDDGPGADPASTTRNGRLGLRLVRGRLEALYGDRATFAVETAPGSGFAVHIEVPVSRVSITPRGGLRTWSER
jgi:sensor histidine kinase YesM